MKSPMLFRTHGFPTGRDGFDSRTNFAMIYLNHQPAGMCTNQTNLKNYILTSYNVATYKKTHDSGHSTSKNLDFGTLKHSTDPAPPPKKKQPPNLLDCFRNKNIHFVENSFICRNQKPPETNPLLRPFK